MNKVLKVVVIIIGVLLTLAGIGWLVDPVKVAGDLGMPLLEGVGRSTQIGDLAAFFLTAGSCILIAVITGKRTWYYPAAMLVGLAAFGRLLAWLVHDAALALDLIMPELVMVALLITASRKLTSE